MGNRRESRSATRRTALKTLGALGLGTAGFSVGTGTAVAEESTTGVPIQVLYESDMEDREIEVNEINNAGQVVGYRSEYISPGDDPAAIDSSCTKPLLWEPGPSDYIWLILDVVYLDSCFLGTNSAEGINETGLIVGTSVAGTSVAVAWEEEGSFGYEATVLDWEAQYSGAYGVNDSRQIVGERWLGASGDQAALWEESQSEYTTTNLGTLPSHKQSRAVDINNSGRIVGSSFSDYTDDSQAVVWEKGSSGYTITKLDPLSGHEYGEAYGINETCQIVGVSYSSDGSPRAVMWEKGSSSYTVTGLGGGAGDFRSSAEAINGAGQIVGNIGGRGAVVWEENPSGYTVTDLGTLPGDGSIRAVDINNSGQIVGEFIWPRPRSADPGKTVVLWSLPDSSDRQ